MHVRGAEAVKIEPLDARPQYRLRFLEGVIDVEAVYQERNVVHQMAEAKTPGP